MNCRWLIQISEVLENILKNWSRFTTLYTCWFALNHLTSKDLQSQAIIRANHILSSFTVCDIKWSWARFFFNQYFSVKSVTHYLSSAIYQTWHDLQTIFLTLMAYPIHIQKVATVSSLHKKITYYKNSCFTLYTFTLYKLLNLFFLTL